MRVARRCVLSCVGRRRIRVSLGALLACLAGVVGCAYAAIMPSLAVGATPGLGEEPAFTFDEYSLSDRAVVKVNVANGNLLVREVDVDRTNTDFEYDVTRTYNSLKASSTHFGILVQKGWIHDLGITDIRAGERANGDVDLYLPTGKEVTFTKTAGGYTPPAKSNLRLRLEGGTFVLSDVSADQELRFWHVPNGKGNLSLLSDGAFEISRLPDRNLIDTLSRVIEFRYVPDSFWATHAAGVDFDYDVSAVQGNWPKELRQARAADGSWSSQYAYDANKRLARIVTGGREIRIGYDASGRVASITEAAPGTADRVTTYTYSSGSTQKRDPSGRVTTTSYGSDLAITGSTSGATPPTLALSGTLYAAREQRLSADTVYGLDYAVSDADGIAMVEFLDDGQDDDQQEPDCTAGCGSVSGSFRLDPADWGPGWHSVSVAVTDRVGDQRTMQFRVEIPDMATDDVPPADNTEPGPDTDTPLTGAACETAFGAGSVYCAPDPIEFGAFAPTNRLIYGIADPDMLVLEEGNPELDPNGHPVWSYLKNPLFQSLQVRRVRALVPWNLMNFERRVNSFQQFYELALDEGMQITVSFQFGCHADLPPSGELTCYQQDGTGPNHRYAPSPDEYVRAVRKFKDHFKRVRYMSAWNEPNDSKQPTRMRKAGWGTGPKTAAKYTYLLEKHVCRPSRDPEGNPCDVLGGELGAGGTAMTYMKRYRAELRRLHDDTLDTRYPRFWAYHPYGDIRRDRRTTKRTQTVTARMMKYLPEGGQMWFTEAGSRIDSVNWPGPRNSLPRQADEVHFLTHRLAPWFTRVTRVYYYQFCRSRIYLVPEDEWDSGLLASRQAGQPWCSGPRDAYNEYKSATLQNPDG